MAKGRYTVTTTVQRNAPNGYVQRLVMDTNVAERVHGKTGARSIVELARAAYNDPLTAVITAPDIPPASGGGTILANYVFTKGWATFGVALAQGVATGSVMVSGGSGQQTDVKRTWSDGSIKHAVVTSYIPATGPYNIVTGSASPGTFTPVWPSASVQFTLPGGATYQANLPVFSNADPWLDGAIVRESRVIVTPDSGGSPHPLLQVVFDVRAYTAGAFRVDAQIQNIKDVTAGAELTFDVVFTVNGINAYSATLVQPYLQRWRKVYSSFAPSFVTHDFTPFYASGAIPKFLSTVISPSYTVGAQFGPLQYGDMSADMAAPGGRPEICPYPDWVAQYLVHKSQSQFDYMIASANLSGSWRGAITEADGKTLINLDTYPTYWLDGRAGTHAVPNSDGFVGPNATRSTHNGAQWPGGWSNPIENAHMPATNYVPYLVTGDRFHMDQMKFYANFAMLSTWPAAGSRQTRKGILLFENQARGIAWAMRMLADVAAYIPDADSMKQYFNDRMQYNLDGLETIGATATGGFLETIFNFKLYGTNNSQYIVTSLWANAYIAWMLDHAEDLGFSPIATTRDRIIRTQVAFFSNDPTYPKVRGGPYYPTVGDGATLYTTIAQVFAGCQATDNRVLTDYLPEARMMCQIGALQGVANAQAAIDYINSIIGTAVQYHSGFAVLPGLSH